MTRRSPKQRDPAVPYYTGQHFPPCPTCGRGVHFLNWRNNQPDERWHTCGAQAAQPAHRNEAM